MATSGFATTPITVTVTYTETTTATRAGGSLTETWTFPVVPDTTAGMNAAADQCVNNQFANMKSAAAGNSISIGAHSTGTARANAPLAP
jgi:hypothetical protein